MLVKENPALGLVAIAVKKKKMKKIKSSCGVCTFVWPFYISKQQHVSHHTQQQKNRRKDE